MSGGSGVGSEPRVAGPSQTPHPPPTPRPPSVFTLGLCALPRTCTDLKQCQEMSGSRQRGRIFDPLTVLGRQYTLPSLYFVEEENELREVASCPKSYSGSVASGEWRATYPDKGSCPWRAVLPRGCLTVPLCPLTMAQDGGQHPSSREEDPRGGACLRPRLLSEGLNQSRALKIMQSC